MGKATKKKNKGGGGTKKKAKGGKMRSFKKPSFSGGNPGSSGGETPKVENPFEIRMHRSKHDNLGRRARHEKGLPGVSRSKAIEKRRETLLKEYQIRNKSSILVDKRIGEKIKNMPEEEKIIRRSVMEKKRQYKQKSIFNLPSTEDILTHKGQVLMNIDRYENPMEESDSEDERLNEEFVSDAHFAGDFLKVKQKAADEVDEDEGKTRKDIIAELILNSKKRKMEKAKEADETYELVTKLDDEFKTPDFRSLLNFVGKERGVTVTETAVTTEKEPEPEPEPPKPKNEEYDKIVRELQFEAKTGLASNPLKIQKQIQEEEQQPIKKLQKLPAEQIPILEMIHSTINHFTELLQILDLADNILEFCNESKRYCPEVVKLLLDILEAVSLPPEKLRLKRRRLEFLRIDPTERTDWDKNQIPEPTENESGTCTVPHVYFILLRVFDMFNKFFQTQHKKKIPQYLVYKVMETQYHVLKINWANTQFHESLFSKRLTKSAIAPPEGEQVEDDFDVVPVDRPKILKLYEPLIEENFDGNKRRKLKRKGQTVEASRLSHKVKKEMKSAAREILKDNAFLAKQQLRDQAMKDEERNRRVKEILGGLSNQEGDYRRLKKQK